MAVSTFTKAGNKATTTAKLDKKVFGVVPTSHELLKTAYVAYLSNGRDNYAQTLKRGEVSGGGRKPWKQKGTGRARFGSTRNPIWRGGGIAFGPTGNENYTKKLHTTAKRQAIRQALSLAAESNKVIVIEGLQFSGKTSDAVKLLDRVGAKRNIVIAVADKTPELVRSISNLSNVKLVQARYLNVFDLLNADSVVFTSDALKAVTEWLSPSSKAAENKGGDQ